MGRAKILYLPVHPSDRIKDHHQKIEKVAAVTASGFLLIMPPVTSHFDQAEIRHFAWHDKEAAMDWLKSDNV